MKLACVLIFHFPIKTEWIRYPHLRDKPTLLVESHGSAKRVTDWSPDLRGLQRGIGLQEALTKVKGPHILDHDSVHYQTAFQGVLDSLEQVSPLVEDNTLGTAYVDLHGLESLYSGEAGTARAVDAAPGLHWKARVGLGTSKFAALVATLSATPGHPAKAPSPTDPAWKDLSVDLFPVSFETRARLHAFALHTLGDVADLSPGPLQAQFGSEGKVIWDLAQGIDIEPLRPRPWETPITEGLSYEDPTTSLQSVITAVELLLKRALSRPEIYGRMARTITLIGHGYSGASWEKHYSFKSPTRDERRILSRVWMSLEDTTLPEPLEALSLTLKHITGEGGVQKSLFPEVRRREELNKTIRQLNANLGKAAPLFNLKELEPWSRIPEERHALVQYVP